MGGPAAAAAPAAMLRGVGCIARRAPSPALMQACKGLLLLRSLALLAGTVHRCRPPAGLCHLSDRTKRLESVWHCSASLPRWLPDEMRAASLPTPARLHWLLQSGYSSHSLWQRWQLPQRPPPSITATLSTARSSGRLQGAPPLLNHLPDTTGGRALAGETQAPPSVKEGKGTIILCLPTLPARSRSLQPRSCTPAAAIRCIEARPRRRASPCPLPRRLSAGAGDAATATGQNAARGPCRHRAPAARGGRGLRRGQPRLPPGRRQLRARGGGPGGRLVGRPPPRRRLRRRTPGRRRAPAPAGRPRRPPQAAPGLAAVRPRAAGAARHSGASRAAQH